MAIERNDRTYQLSPNNGNSNDSFLEHDRQMREFRASHAHIALVNGPRLDDEATFLEGLLFLRINYIMETGGSALLNEAMDWSALIPVWKVAQYKLSQN